MCIRDRRETAPFSRKYTDSVTGSKLLEFGVKRSTQSIATEFRKIIRWFRTMRLWNFLEHRVIWTELTIRKRKTKRKRKMKILPVQTWNAEIFPPFSGVWTIDFAAKIYNVHRSVWKSNCIFDHSTYSGFGSYILSSSRYSSLIPTMRVYVFKFRSHDFMTLKLV